MLVYVQTRSASVGGYSEFIIGAAVVVVLMLFPEGLASIPALLGRRLHLTRGVAELPGPDAVEPGEVSSIIAGADPGEHQGGVNA